MTKRKLDIRFHNPNTDIETANYIARIFLEASKVKFENVLKSTFIESVEAKDENDCKEVITNI